MAAELDTHAAHQAQAATEHIPGRAHLLVAGVLAVLTLIAFFAVGEHWMSNRALVPILLGMAFLQILLQALYYMRLRVTRSLFALFFGAGALLAALIIVMLYVLLPL